MTSHLNFPLPIVALLSSIVWNVDSLTAQTSCSYQSGEIAVCIQNITAISIFARARLAAVEKENGFPYVWDTDGNPLPVGHPFYNLAAPQRIPRRSPRSFIKCHNEIAA